MAYSPTSAKENVVLQWFLFSAAVGVLRRRFVSRQAAKIKYNF
jgi:hypothetical protein